VKREEYEKRYGKLPDDVTYVDLDAQKPVLTSGWTDEQILGKTPQQLKGMIRQGEKAVAIMQQNIEREEQRIASLRLVLARRMELSNASHQ
jgi:phage terminase large subunit-like protein